MDFSAIASMIATFILGIGVVGITVSKFLPKIAKYIHIAKDALDVADTAIEALKDNQITPEEINILVAKVQNMKIDLRS